MPSPATKWDVTTPARGDRLGNVLVSGLAISKARALARCLASAQSSPVGYITICALLAAAPLHLASCKIPSLNLEGKTCPCEAPWVCDDGRCRLSSTGDGGNADSSGDGSTSGGCSSCPVGAQCRDNQCIPSFRSFLRVGGAGADEVRGIAIGDARYLVGSFQREVMFERETVAAAGDRDIFIARYSNDELIWLKVIGAAEADIVYDIAIDDADNIYTVGEFRGMVDFGGGVAASANNSTDVFVASYSSGGEHRWSVRAGDQGLDRALSVATDASNNVYVIGRFEGNANFGGGARMSAGSSDVFVASYDSEGMHRWSRRFGDAGFQEGFAIDANANGDLIIGGRFGDTIAFDDQMLTSTGSTDAFIAGLDGSDGSHRWSFSLGGEMGDVLTDVAIAEDGESFAIGRFEGRATLDSTAYTSVGQFDHLLLQIDSSGALSSVAQVGGADEEILRTITLDSAGAPYVAAEFRGVIDIGLGAIDAEGRRDLMTVAYDRDWTPRWAHVMKSSGGAAYALAIDETNVVHVGGLFTGGIEVGEEFVGSLGGNDGFYFSLLQ